METVARLSSKNQFTVPSWARQALGLEAGQRVLVRVEGRRIVLTRVADELDRLEGALRGAYGDANEYVASEREDRSP